eukprot:XP_019918114.1 PREDICTED: pericentrin-like [Crassostrea gigas]
MSDRPQSGTRPKVRHHWSRDGGGRDRIQRLYGKYLLADSNRKALVYQKKYLLLLLGGFWDCEQTTVALIANMGVYPSPEDLQRGTRPRRPVTAFRSAARVVVAVTSRFLSVYCSCRMRYLVRKWKRTTRVGSPVMGAQSTSNKSIPQSDQVDCKTTSDCKKTRLFIYRLRTSL